MSFLLAGRDIATINCVTTQITIELDRHHIERAAESFKILADPTRLSIIWALLHGEHSVNNLADHVKVPAPAVSQHLAKLRLAGLVQTRREGTHIFYLVTDEHVRELVEGAVHHVAHVEYSRTPSVKGEGTGTRTKGKRA
jgi:DNA-binding transcriptional ArsR family regulator